MLSHIYRAAQEFEKEHGFPPNLLYMNYAHLECLKQQLEDPNDFNDLVRFLGMELIVTQESAQPTVAWVRSPWRQALAV